MNLVSSEKPIRSRSGNWQSQDTGTPVLATKGAPLSSKAQSLIEGYLKDWFPHQRMLTNYRPPWLKGLELDIYFPDLEIAVEVQGLQHQSWVPGLQETANDFLRQKENDKVKVNICRNRGVALYHIAVSTQTLRKLRVKMWREKRVPTMEVPAEQTREWRGHCKFLCDRYRSISVRIPF